MSTVTVVLEAHGHQQTLLTIERQFPTALS
jgi:hypothetical protein